MKVNDIKIKEPKTEGLYTLKGFEKDGIYVGKNTIQMPRNILQSRPTKEIPGVGMQVRPSYLFSPAKFTAEAFKAVAIDETIFNKQKSVMETVKSTIEQTKDTLKHTISDIALNSVYDKTRNTEEKDFDKGGER